MKFSSGEEVGIGGKFGLEDRFERLRSRFSSSPEVDGPIVVAFANLPLQFYLQGLKAHKRKFLWRLGEGATIADAASYIEGKFRASVEDPPRLIKSARREAVDLLDALGCPLRSISDRIYSSSAFVPDAVCTNSVFDLQPTLRADADCSARCNGEELIADAGNWTQAPAGTRDPGFACAQELNRRSVGYRGTELQLVALYRFAMVPSRSYFVTCESLVRKAGANAKTLESLYIAANFVKECGGMPLKIGRCCTATRSTNFLRSLVTVPLSVLNEAGVLSAPVIEADAKSDTVLERRLSRSGPQA